MRRGHRRFTALLLGSAMLLSCLLPVSAEMPAEPEVQEHEHVETVEVAEPTPEAAVVPAEEPTAEPATVAEPEQEPAATPETVIAPTEEPAAEPTEEPAATVEPTQEPTAAPEETAEPASEPTDAPENTVAPTEEPAAEPEATAEPSIEPTPDVSTEHIPYVIAEALDGGDPFPIAPKADDMAVPNISFASHGASDMSVLNFCEGVTVTVTDSDLVSVSFDGQAVSVEGGSASRTFNGSVGDLTLENWHDTERLRDAGTHTVTATDAAGHVISQVFYVWHFLGGRYSEDRPATCTEDEHEEQIYICQTCHKQWATFSFKKDGQKALGHAWKPAGETKEIDGKLVTQYKCERCGATEYFTEVSEDGKDGTSAHDMQQVDRQEPTCDRNGYIKYQCSHEGCTETKIETLYAVGHKFDDWTTTTVTDICGTQKITTHTCEVCGYKEEVVLGYVSKEHSFVWAVGKGSTCSENGEWVEVCSKCGVRSGRTQPIPKASHTFNDWHTTKEASCSETGIKQRECQKCDAVETDVIPKLQHTWTEWTDKEPATCTKPGSQERRCELCNATETRKVAQLKHVAAPDDHDCTTPTVCASCGAVMKAAPYAEHTYSRLTYTTGDATGHWSTCVNPNCQAKKPGSVKPHVPVQASCLSPVVCQTCNYVIQPATYSEHTYASGWTSNANAHWHACTNPCSNEKGCPAMQGYAQHTPAPDDGDCTTPVKCSVCGYVLVPAKAHVWSKTYTSNGANGHYQTCTNAGCRQHNTLIAHTAALDDNNCATPVKCTGCGYIMVAAKAHQWGECISAGTAGHYRKCKNDGCAQSSSIIAHVGQDDGNCTTALICTDCHAEIKAAMEHQWANAYTSLGAEGHYQACANLGCTEHLTSPHLAVDDGDPATALVCTLCGYVITPAQEPQEEGVEGFVERLYNVCMGRKSDEGGKTAWSNALYNHDLTGADAASGFIFSDEFERKNYNNRDFVTQLYRAFMGREPDEGGLNAWTDALNNGSMSREEAVQGFAASDEFGVICNNYGIIASPQAGDAPAAASSTGNGNGGSTAAAPAGNGSTQGFVERLYNVCMGRQSDPEGLNAWTGALNNHDLTGTEAARGFLTSHEFQSKNLSNRDFVVSLYRAFMGREPDEGGLNAWTGALNEGSLSRDEAISGFASSPEFGSLCDSYGIIR